jgi:exosortase
MTMMRAARWVPAALLGGLILLLYADVVPSMIARWWEDEGYSHGFLVAPLAGWLAWRQRAAVAAVAGQPDTRGLLAVLIAAACYVVGKLGAEFFLTRMSLILLLTGLIWTFWGWERLKRLAFPLLLLASTVPLPVLVYNRLAGPLQLVASAASTEVAQGLGISVYRDGTSFTWPRQLLGWRKPVAACARFPRWPLPPCCCVIWTCGVAARAPSCF